jgi:hypothetical protein
MSSWLGGWFGGSSPSSKPSSPSSAASPARRSGSGKTPSAAASPLAAADPTHRVSLAFRGLQEIHPMFAGEAGPTLTELDLSSNALGGDFLVLLQFPKLRSLILDNNNLTTNALRFPRHAALRTLWMNNNKLDNLVALANKLVGAFPSLSILSLLNNPACPNYFNGGTPRQYADYRLYLLSRIPALTVIDSTPVSAQERAEAAVKYGDASVHYGAVDAQKPVLVEQSNDVLQNMRAAADAAAAAPAPRPVVSPAATSSQRSRRKMKMKKPGDQAPAVAAVQPAAVAVAGATRSAAGTGLVPSLDELESVAYPPPPLPYLERRPIDADELPSFGHSSSSGSFDEEDSDGEDVF